MTAAERKHINNGIWLCDNCSRVIDDDANSYPADRLRQMKARHEESRYLHPDRRPHEQLGDLIAIGPNIVCVGHITGSGSSSFRLQATHFLMGTGNDLISIAGDFDRLPVRDRYMLLNELGYGLTLDTGMEVEKVGSALDIRLSVNPAEKRNPWDGKMITMDRDMGRMLTGFDAFTQHIESLLGTAIGDSIFHPRSGSRISQFYHDYAGSPWLERLIKMDVIRLASIIVDNKLYPSDVPPLRCINTVNEIKVLDLELTDQTLPLKVQLDLKGYGPWEQVIRLFIYTTEQLEAARARQVPSNLKGIVD
ncbi:hypothetical protein [Bosea beijingensis]